MDVFHEVPRTFYMQPTDVRALVASPQNFAPFIVNAVNEKTRQYNAIKKLPNLATG